MLDLYPRGFIGAEQGPSTEKRPKPIHEIQQAQNTFRIVTKNTDQKHRPNTNVETLFMAVVRDEPYIHKLDFKKKVLQAALHAFGTEDFKFWFEMQQKSPSFGDNHSDFLDDTLRFISTGRRYVHLMTWNELVQGTDVGETRSHLSEYASTFFRDNSGTDLTEIIQRWVSQPNGLEDLLFSLHILFGNK